MPLGVLSDTFAKPGKFKLRNLKCDAFILHLSLAQSLFYDNFSDLILFYHLNFQVVYLNCTFILRINLEF